MREPSRKEARERVRCALRLPEAREARGPFERFETRPVGVRPFCIECGRPMRREAPHVMLGDAPIAKRTSGYCKLSVTEEEVVQKLALG